MQIENFVKVTAPNGAAWLGEMKVDLYAPGHEGDASEDASPYWTASSVNLPDPPDGYRWDLVKVNGPSD